MKLKNSTDFPDYFLRRLVAWCCCQSRLPVRAVKLAEFRNRCDNYSGHAYHSMRFVVSTGKAGFPMEADHREGMGGEIIADRIESLVAVTAHEIEHLCQYHENRSRTLHRRRRSEPVTRAHEVRCLRLFRAHRDLLLAEWNAEPAVRTVGPNHTRQKKNEANARKLLATWERKLKLARTKVSAYRRKVRRYDCIAAARAPKGGAA